jgi:hypothetical protein
MSGEPTKKTAGSEMRDEYDFSAGVRGKYAKGFAESTNVVALDPDVAAQTALPQLGDVRAVPALEEALQSESVAFIGDAVRDTLAELRQ